MLNGKPEGMTSGSLISDTRITTGNTWKRHPVENGNELEGNIPNPRVKRLDSTIQFMDDPNLADFWIEATTMHMEVTVGAFKEFKLTGSKTNDEEHE